MIVIMDNYEWIAMNFRIDIHGPQRVNPNNFGDPRTFPVALPPSQIFHFSSETFTRWIGTKRHKS